VNNPERFVVAYVAGPYSGKRVVWAQDEEEAVSKVRSSVRREMSLPMYYESYRPVDEHGNHVPAGHIDD